MGERGREACGVGMRGLRALSPSAAVPRRVTCGAREGVLDLLLTAMCIISNPAGSPNPEEGIQLLFRSRWQLKYYMRWV